MLAERTYEVTEQTNGRTKSWNERPTERPNEVMEWTTERSREINYLVNENTPPWRDTPRVTYVFRFYSYILVLIVRSYIFIFIFISFLLTRRNG